MRAGQVDLRTAQQEIAHDWIAAYKKYVSPMPLAGKARSGKHPRGTGRAAGDASALRDEDPDTETVSATASVPTTTPAVQVWVNTESGVIWKPGSQFYGKTKKGKYMDEADALAAGYHDAK